MVWFLCGQTLGSGCPVEVRGGGGVERYGVFSGDGGIDIIIKNNNNDGKNNNNKIIVLNGSVSGSNNCAKVSCER